MEVNEGVFRWEMNEDVMANDKLSEGIRKFAADAVKLENIIKQKLQWLVDRQWLTAVNQLTMQCRQSISIEWQSTGDSCQLIKRYRRWKWLIVYLT